MTLPLPTSIQPRDFQGIAYIGEYPLGALEARLEPDILTALSDYNLHEMSCKDIHQTLFDLRHRFNLEPWHILTAVMQSYGYAAFRREIASGHSKITKDQAWCVGSGGKRPLRIFFQDYIGIHDVRISEPGGETHLVGKLIEKVDNDKTGAYYWSYQTERLLKTWMSGTKMEVPFTGLIGSNICCLENWKMYQTADGTIVVPIFHRAPKKCTSTQGDAKKKRKQVRKQPEETPDLPNLTVDEKPVENPLRDDLRKRRVQILVMMQSVLSPKLFNIYTFGHLIGVEADTAKELIAHLDKPLKAYVALLTSGKPVEARLPDDLVLACRSITELGIRENQGGVIAAVTMWYKELAFTDPTRIMDKSM